MEIQAKTFNHYAEVKIIIAGTTIDFGLCDKSELEKMSSELLSASLEIQELVPRVKPIREPVS
jgi:uncharacterized protein with ATP-grasp and redox domains